MQKVRSTRKDLEADRLALERRTSACLIFMQKDRKINDLRSDFSYQSAEIKE